LDIASDMAWESFLGTGSQMSERRDLIEHRAARIVADRLGADFHENDTGSEPSQYDFRLCYPDGRGAALEVTEHAGQDLMRLLGPMDKHGSKFPAPSLVKAWHLYPEDCTVPYRKLSTEIVARATPFLSHLEGDGSILFHNDREKPSCPEL